MSKERLSYELVGDASDLQKAVQEGVNSLKDFAKSRVLLQQQAASANDGSRAFEMLQKRLQALMASLITFNSTLGRQDKKYLPEFALITYNALNQVDEALLRTRTNTNLTNEELTEMSKALFDVCSHLDRMKEAQVGNAQATEKVREIYQQALQEIEKQKEAVTESTEAVEQEQKAKEAAKESTQDVTEEIKQNTEEVKQATVAKEQATQAEEQNVQVAEKQQQAKKRLTKAEREKIEADKQAAIIAEQQRIAKEALADLDQKSVEVQQKNVEVTREKTVAQQEELEVTKESIEVEKQKTKTVKQSKSEQEELAETVEKVAAAEEEAKKASKKLDSALDRLNKTTENIDKSFSNLAATTKALSKVFSYAKGIFVGRMWSKAINESIAYIETLNLFRVAFNKAIEPAEEFVKTMQELWGLDPETVMRSTAEFYNLAVAVDMPTKAAQNLSMGLTQLGMDLSSLFNMPVDRVMDNLQSGMQGMTRAVRKYGMDIRMTTLETTALTLGMEVNARTMSEADRIGLRYITMVNQAKLAIGDYARTMESPANLLKVLIEQTKQFSRALGNFFVGAIGWALPYINAFIMALRTMLEFLNALVGFTPMTFSSPNFGDDIEDGMDRIGSAAQGAAGSIRKLQKILAPFDEINILQEPRSASGSEDTRFDGMGEMSPAIREALEALNIQFDNVALKANQVRDSILRFFGFDYDEEGNLTWSISQLEASLSRIAGTNVDLAPLVESFKHLGDAVQDLMSKGWDGLVWLWNNLLVPFSIWTVTDVMPIFFEMLSTALGLLGTIITAGRPVFTWYFESFLKPLASWSGDAIVATLRLLGNTIVWLTGIVEEHKWIVQGVQIYLMAKYTLLGAKALASGAAQVAAWTMSKVAAVANTAVMAVKFLLNIGHWTNLKIAALASAAGVVKAWVMQKLAALNTAAITVSQFVLMAGKWAWFGIKAMAGGAKVAAAWLLALGPIGLVIAAVAAVTAAVLLNWDTVVSATERLARALDRIFRGISNSFITVANTFTRAINVMIRGVLLPFNALIKGLNRVPGVNIPKLSLEIPRIPMLATGGVVTKPTLAMIGEGKYNEAVIPLGNSPQMQELVNSIIQAMKSDGGGGGGAVDVTIPIYIAGHKVDEVVVKGINKGSKRVGTNTVYV